MMRTSTELEIDRSRSLLIPRQPKAARAEAGREHRTAVPLEAHAELVVPSDRASALSILRAEDVGRVQELVPIRYGRMLATPFTFLRGSAGVMAADLAAGPRTGLEVQLSGDAHLSNFGVFTSPEQRFVLDLNDFDETLLGPFEWDVKRLAASIIVAGRHNEFDRKFTRKAARAAVGAYRSAVGAAAAMNPLDLFYFKVDADDAIAALKTSKQERARIEKNRKKAARKNSLGALNKLTEVVDGRRQIVSNPPLIEALRGEQRDREMERVETFFADYRETLNADRRHLIDRFSLTDLARKVVGVGSVGTRCLIAFFESGDGEPLFLQIKEAGTSVLEPHLQPSGFEQEGERVVDGQRRIQATPDALLGWARSQPIGGPAIDFYVRQLWNGKASAVVEGMPERMFEQYGCICGSILARAHARSADASMIAGYLGDDDTFDRAVVEFAETYANRTEQDFAELIAAVDDGQVPIVRDL